MSKNTLPELPMTEATFYILASLASGRKHGYAILKHVETLSEGDVTLSTSTLYTALLRLQDQNLIERVDADGAPPGNPGLPRKEYQLSDLGRRALGAELTRLRRQLSAGEMSLSRECSR